MIIKSKIITVNTKEGSTGIEVLYYTDSAEIGPLNIPLPESDLSGDALQDYIFKYAPTQQLKVKETIKSNNIVHSGATALIGVENVKDIVDVVFVANGSQPITTGTQTL